MKPFILEPLTQPRQLAMSWISCMARRKISNELWAALAPLMPMFEASPKGGVAGQAAGVWRKPHQECCAVCANTTRSVGARQALWLNGGQPPRGGKKPART